MVDSRTYPVPAKISRVLFVDHQGYGFSVRWTLDGDTWVTGRYTPHKYVADKYFHNLMEEELSKGNTPDVRYTMNFFGYIPMVWVTAKTRVLS